MLMFPVIWVSLSFLACVFFLAVRYRWMRSVLTCLYFAVVGLIAVESMMMILLSIFLDMDRGSVVFAAIMIFPVWAILLMFYYIIERRWRWSIVLWLCILLGALKFVEFS